MIKQAVILAGGLGTRLSEETSIRPKPMVEIGGQPIILHIMKYYSHFGVKDFIICGGYKADVIKQYFMNYALLNSDISIDLQHGKIKPLQEKEENWNIKVFDTGLHTQTGGRLLRVKEHLDKQFY